MRVWELDEVEWDDDDKDPRGSRTFMLVDCMDEDEAVAGLLDIAPAAWLGMVRKTRHLELIGTNADNSEDFRATVNYGKASNSAVGIGDWKFRFSTKGGTAKRTQSLETLGVYPTGGETAPEPTGAINETDDGVDGCDIIVPQFNFSIVYNHHPANLSLSYALACAGLTGKVNSHTFLGRFPVGTVLFHGAEGEFEGSTSYDPSDDTVKPVQISYEFSASPDGYVNAAGISASKPGWAFAWWLYKEVTDTTSKRTKKKPLCLFVERVYDATSFSALGINILG